MKPVLQVGTWAQAYILTNTGRALGGGQVGRVVHIKDNKVAIEYDIRLISSGYRLSWWCKIVDINLVEPTNDEYQIPRYPDDKPFGCFDAKWDLMDYRWNTEIQYIYKKEVNSLNVEEKGD